MNRNPLLSIVIPTRNRQNYAICCLQSILSIENSQFEVVVQDNSDTNELKLLIDKNINDYRLIYHYDPLPMSTVHNFNKAMEHVKGEYLCFIGDDDGINPDIIEAAIWAKKNNLDALVEKTHIYYLWPSANRTGKHLIYPFTGKFNNVNIKSELNKFLKDGGVYYQNYDLPKVYHGIVKKDCFDIIAKELGYYFGGLSADIFTSIALSLIVNRVVAVDYPLTIAGSSSASEETHRTEKAKFLKLENAPHFRARGDYLWSKDVPSVYSVATIWAESSLKAIELFKRDDLKKKINRLRLSVYISLEAPHHEKFILQEFLKIENKKLLLLNYRVIKLMIIISVIMHKVKNRIKRYFGNKKTIENISVSNINEAMEISYKFVRDQKMSFNDIIQNLPK